MKKGSVKRVSKSTKLDKSSMDVVLSRRQKLLVRQLKVGSIEGKLSRQKRMEPLTFNVSIQGCTYPFMYTRLQLNEAYGRAMDSVIRDAIEDGLVK